MEWDYKCWTVQNETDTKLTEALAYEPRFSVLVPEGDAADHRLAAVLASVSGQTYRNYEILRYNDRIENSDAESHADSNGNGDSSVVDSAEASDSTAVSSLNDAIEKAAGEYLLFLHGNEVLSENALFECAKLLNENPSLDLIYSDEDRLSEDGSDRYQPFFKPDWSPDLFMDFMYIRHLAVYRTEIVKKIGGFRPGFGRVRDYDLAMRFLEQSKNDNVGHIPKILCHCMDGPNSRPAGPSEAPEALPAVLRLKEEALRRRGISGTPVLHEDINQYVVTYENPAKPLVSIIIPSRDHVDILRQCIDAIRAHTAYPNYEIIVVDNGSALANRAAIEEYLRDKATYLYREMDFNFSAMCNLGAEAAHGDFFLLLNDDVRVFQDDWLDSLVGHASLPHTGAVGAKLLYPDSDLIQHDGILNLPVGPRHTLLRWSDTSAYHFGRNRVSYDYLAVTAACLLVKAELYRQAGGMNEELPVAYNDVDFCCKLYEAGFYHVVRNDVKAYHHEALSRGSDEDTPRTRAQQKAALEALYRRHEELRGKDPFYNKNFAEDNPYFGIRVDWDALATGDTSAAGDAPATGDASADGGAPAAGSAPAAGDAQRIVRPKPHAIKENPCTMDCTVTCARDNIIFLGWAYTGDHALDAEAEKALCIELRRGVLMELPTIPYAREDAMNAVNASTPNLGFIAVMKSPFAADRRNTYPVWIRYRTGSGETYFKGLPAVTFPITEDAPRFRKAAPGLLDGCRETGIEGVLETIDPVTNEAGAAVSVKGWTVITEDPEANILTKKRLLHETADGALFAATLPTELRADLLPHFKERPGVIRGGFRGEIPLFYEDETGKKEISADGTWSVIAENLLTGVRYLRRFMS